LLLRIFLVVEIQDYLATLLQGNYWDKKRLAK
jgi:hypothetical protein